MKYLKIFRVREWLHYLGYVLLGSLVSKNLNAINFALGSAMLAYAFSINDYYDKKLKEKHFMLPLIASFISLSFLNELQHIFYFSFIALFTLSSWPQHI